jgi:hypothetical protein
MGGAHRSHLLVACLGERLAYDIVNPPARGLLSTNQVDGFALCRYPTKSIRLELCREVSANRIESAELVRVTKSLCVDLGIVMFNIVHKILVSVFDAISFVVIVPANDHCSVTIFNEFFSVSVHPLDCFFFFRFFIHNLLILCFFNLVDNHLDLVVTSCPRCAVTLYDTAGVSFIHRLDEYGAVVGECYLEYGFFFHLLFVSHFQYQ